MKVALILLGAVVLAVVAADLGAGGSVPRGDDLPVLAIAAIRDGVSQILVVDARGKLIAEPTQPGGAHSPSWSPDGERIAFCSGDNYGPAAGDPPQILVMNADGTNAVKLTDEDRFEDYPCWSPDGKKIAFDSQRMLHKQIFVMDADGLNRTNLPNTAIDDGEPAWSPDGKQIAFVRHRVGRTNLWLINPDGSDGHQLPNVDVRGLTCPAWSPDGKQIFFSNRHDDGSRPIFVVNPDGQGLQKITDEAGWNVWPACSPDGRYIAYVHYTGPVGWPGSEHGKIVIRDFIEDTPTPAVLAKLDCGARPAWKPRKR